MGKVYARLQHTVLNCQNMNAPILEEISNALKSACESYL